MKTTYLFPTASLALVLAFSLQPLALLGQGSLTPPGAPAPTMKSLAQIEPRTAITNIGAVTITNSGSYYLTTNITVSSGDAITITANGVTLDLNGFSVSSTASGTGSAITMNGGRTNIAIFNGFIAGSFVNNAGTYSGKGFGYGIYYASSYPWNVRVADVTVSGCLYHGLLLNPRASIVERCTVMTAGGYGILAQTVSDSMVLNCGDYAIVAMTANNCSGECVGSGNGISAATAQNCYGYSISGHGLYATNTAPNCYGYSAGANPALYSRTAENCRGYCDGSGEGVYATAAQNCVGSSVSGRGLSANTTAQNCVGSSTSGFGLYAATAQNCSGSSASGTYGLCADNNAQNCYGNNAGAGTGLIAAIAIGCSGVSVSGTGLNGTTIANSCRGYSTSGTGLTANIANSCGGNTITYTYHYNMPP